MKKTLICTIATLYMLFCVPIAMAEMTFTDEAAFLATIFSPTLESFEGQTATNTRTLPSLTLPDFTMTMSANDQLGVFDQLDFFGGHATDGTNYIGFSDFHDSVTYAFNSQIKVFGINIIDFGDYGTGTITFVNNAGDNFVAAISNNNSNGNEQFFGLVSDFNFSQIIMTKSISGEFYAIDEIYYAVPEPATLCLLGLGGLALRRKNRP